MQTGMPISKPIPLSRTRLDQILTALAHEEAFVFLDTSRPTAPKDRSLLFLRPKARLTFRAGESLDAFFQAIDAYRKDGAHLAGWFAYEFGLALEPVLAPLLEKKQGLPLADLGVFESPAVLDHATGAWRGLPAWLAEQVASGDEPFSLSPPTPAMPRETYLGRVARIKEYISAGDTYQVNFTTRFQFDFTGSATALYRRLRSGQRVGYGALLRLPPQEILSFSPELFFRRAGNQCLVRPMKGTAARGLTLEEDLARMAGLRNDPKNRSENVMIVDLLRNDLGRLCIPGGVRTESLFDVESFRTLLQMTSTVRGTLREGVSLRRIFEALFPCGSVTGAPKIRTMQIIQELESGPRGVYTGAIGSIAPDGDMMFSVPIRTIVLEDGHGEMGIGSGIVADSDPDSEWRECLLKGRFLTDPPPRVDLIETMLWSEAGGFWLLDRHLDRLETSALFFHYPFQRDVLTARLAEMENDWRREAALPRRVRVLLHEDGELTITTSAAALPAVAGLPVPPVQPTAPFPRVLLSPEATAPDDLFLRHKTTRRDLYDRQRERAMRSGCIEVVFRNTRGELTEGAITNLVILRNGRYLTPPLDCGLLPGVFRAHLLATSPEMIEERVLFPADLETADAIYIANSVRGLVEVRLATEPT